MEEIEIDSAIELCDKNGQSLIEKYSCDSLVSLLDRALLQRIQGIYRLKEDGLDMVQFSRFFMNCLPHKEKQGLFLASGLGQLFKEIAKGHSKIKFSDITDFICQRILQFGEKDQHLHTRWIPTRGHLVNNLQYLSHPAEIKGGKSEDVPKVWHCQSECDKGKHENVIHQAYFSTQQKKLYCLESLADWIGVYDSDAKLTFKLRPSSFKVKKDAAVMGIYFSERQQRLGAILKDFSLSFWDAEDNFQFQKSISIAKYCQQLQSAIWYLEFFQKWVTADNSGSIYLWSLIDEKPEKLLKCKNRAKVTDICQIPSAKVIAVVQEQRGVHAQPTKIQLLGIQSGEVLAEIDTRSERRMLHTLRYSEEHQILLSAGLEKRISLFHISTTYLDSSLKGELLGHESAVTCFTLIKRTPMVVSADDKGKVKIWNIKNLKCMQTIDFSDKVIITRLLDLSTENKIAILGSRITLLHLQKIPQDPVSLTPLRISQADNMFYVFTQKDYRIYSFLNGKVEQINCQYVDPNNQSTFICILSCGKIVVGNEKGQVTIHDRWKKKVTYNWHNGPIIYLQEDKINNLLVSASDHSGFMISHCVNQKWEQLRVLRGNFIGKEISSIAFTPYHSLLGFVTAGRAYFCDYEQLKITLQVKFKEEQPASLAFANGLGLALIGTSKGIIHFVQIDRGQIKYGCKLKICSSAITHIVADLKCKQIKQAIQIQSFTLSCSSEGGRIHIADLTGLAQQYSFRKSKSTSLSFNPLRQLRENFDAQLKKGKIEVLNINSEQLAEMDCKITTIYGHKGEISSLTIGQFDDHLLISSGYDNRVKVWLKERLVGDLNVNRPLPYIWEVQISENRKMARKMLQGFELIQAIFKRFGKDISIAQSKAFKLSAGEKENPHMSSRKLKRKPTLFQEQFTTIDLNYQKIKRQKLIPIGGPSLRRMEMSKIIDNLQKEWDQAKEKEDEQRSRLLKSLQLKAYKNDEKDTVVNILRQRPAHQIHEKRGENSPAIKNLQEKLDNSIAKTEEQAQTSRQSSSNMNKSGSLLRFSCKKNREARDSEARMTFQNYFSEKYQEKLVRNSVKTAITTPEKTQSAKKDHNFRQMLKEMQQRLTKSKKQHLPTLSSSKHFRHLSSMGLGSDQ